MVNDERRGEQLVGAGATYHCLSSLSLFAWKSMAATGNGDLEGASVKGFINPFY